MTEHRVRVADFAVAAAPDVLATLGLGSCVAIGLCLAAWVYLRAYRRAETQPQ